MKLRLSGAGWVAMGAVAWLAACSSSDEPSSAPNNTAGAGSTSAGAPAAGSSAAGAGTAGALTAGSGGAAGSAVVAGAGGSLAMAGAGGSSGGSSAGAGGSPNKGPFTCTEYIGAYLTMEWWNTGFENIVGIDKNKWQLKWHHHGHVLEWGNQNSPFWLNAGDPNNDAQGAPIQSACTEKSTEPDRVVFLALSWEIETEEGWIAALNSDIAAIKAKRPSAKWVDLVTMVRCPMNMQCNPGADYGPGADTSPGRQDCQVYPYVDSAMSKVVAANADFVGLGPKLEMARCNPAHDGAHMTGDGNKQAAKDYAAFYAQHL